MRSKLLAIVMALLLVSFLLGACVPEPDLIVDSVTITPSVPCVDEFITFDVIIKNIGQASTPSGTSITVEFRSKGQLGAHSGCVRGNLKAGSLSDRGSVSFGVYSPPQAGTGTFTVTVDYDNAVAESNEGNNVFSGSFDVVTCEPDLCACLYSGGDTMEMLADGDWDISDPDAGSWGPVNVIPQGDANASDWGVRFPDYPWSFMYDNCADWVYGNNDWESPVSNDHQYYRLPFTVPIDGNCVMVRFQAYVDDGANFYIDGPGFSGPTLFYEYDPADSMWNHDPVEFLVDLGAPAPVCLGPGEYTIYIDHWNTGGIYGLIFTAECVPCQCPCQCGEWDDIEVDWFESDLPTPTGTWTGSCGNTLTINHTEAAYKVSVSFGQSIMNCVNCPSPQPVYYWDVTGSGGVSYSAGGPSSTPNISFPGDVGNYQVVINAECDGVECPPCEIYIEILPESSCIDGDVTDMAVANDGNTIYIISDGHVCKSIDGGDIFTGCPLPTGFVYPAVNIAVAPDNPNAVAVSDSSANEVVWLTTNGCFTWASLGTPCAGGDTVTDLAVSPAIAGTILGRHCFATIADNASGAVALGDVMEIGTTTVWASVGAGLVTGTHDYMAIQVSPGFAGDRSVCVVGVMPTAVALIASVDYQIINTSGAGSVIQTVQFVPPGTTIDYNSALAGAGEIIYADIALPSDFDPTIPSYQRAYVGIGSNPVQTTDDVYRVDHTIVTNLYASAGTGLCIRSIDYSGTTGSGTLLAGEHTTTMVWRTADPSVPLPTWYPAITPPTGVMDAVVGMHPNFATTPNCYAGTSGTGYGFFKSIDGGNNF